MFEEDPTSVFAGYRELLFSIVYNILGSVADTEDVLQEVWLAWAARCRGGAPEILNPRAYLVRIAVNAALDRQGVIARRRETYVGPWLPEPLIADTAPEETLRAESVSMAMLVVLETLTPLERAVFVLHEVFGYPHADIGDMLGRAPATVRQLAHRAREHVEARRPRYRTDPQVQRAVTDKFLAAQAGGDVAELLRLLAPDVVFWSDGGGKQHAALRPIVGADKVARLITGRGFYARNLGIDVGPAWVNGEPAVVAAVDGERFAAAVLDIDPETERIRGIYAVINPDKLGGS